MGGKPLPGPLYAFLGSSAPSRAEGIVGDHGLLATKFVALCGDYELALEPLVQEIVKWWN